MNDIQAPFLSFDCVPKVALEEASLAANSRVCIVAISDNSRLLDWDQILGVLRLQGAPGDDVSIES
jgi:hypothetical protein